MSSLIKVGISPSLKIRGLIAVKNIKKGDVIEKCQMILLPRKYTEFIDKTPLGDYYFEWSDEFVGIALGNGSLYNHSYDANSEFDFDFKNNILVITSVKDIKSGEEITINYNGEFNDRTPLEKSYLRFDK